MALCGKGHDNWSTWISTDGITKKYCKTCRQLRAKTYTDRKKNAKGTHNDKDFQEKLKQFDKCPGCQRRWEDIPQSKGSAKYKITEDREDEYITGLCNRKSTEEKRS